MLPMTCSARQGRRWICALLLPLAALSGCGYESLNPGMNNPADANSADAVADGIQVFELTAAYETRPVDVLIIRDGATRQEPFNGRILSAVPILAARLNYLGPDVRVGVFDHFFTAPASTVNPAAPVVLSTDPEGVMVTSGDPTVFSDGLEARVARAGSRGGSYLPLSVLAAIAREKQLPEGGAVAELLRPGAFLAVLLLTASNAVADPYDTDDIMAMYSAFGSQFSVSTVAPDKTGCVITPSPLRETNPNKVPQRNSEIKLQERTNGLFLSVCAKSFALFLDDWASKGTGSAYFPVELPSVAVPGTIRVLVEGSALVEGHRYLPGTKSLELPTIISPGQTVRIEYQPVGEVVAPVIAGATYDNLPPIADIELPPEQLAFAQTVQPVLQRNCGGCHTSGRPFVLNFASAEMYKSDIVRRIMLPVGQAQRMPPGAAVLSPNDQNVILSWGSP